MGACIYGVFTEEEKILAMLFHGQRFRMYETEVGGPPQLRL